ncbi:hypothetical protein V6N13_139222 [Hibiscus sabdariffa]
MVESSVVAGQVIARDLNSSLASRVGVASKFDLSQFPSLEESLKIGKDEIGGGAVMGSSSKSIDWNLFDQSLKFFPLVEKDGQLLVQPPRSVLDDGAKQWSNALIGTFLGKSPILSVFQRTANRLWGREGSQKALVLRKWVPGMLPEVLSMDSAPVWIRLWHVPLELYSQQGLGYLASALGKPLYTDKATTLRLTLEYAKICVEVNAASSLGFSRGRVLAKQIELENIQKLLLSNPSGELIAREKEVAGELKVLSIAEENLYSRQGAKLDTFEAISNEFVQFFTDSLGTTDDHVVQFSDDLLKQILGVELSAEMQDSLVAHITHKDIKDVLFSMNDV